MSSYKSFAIVGYGAAGSLFTNALLESIKPSDLRILTRSADKKELQDVAAKGVILKAVDYASQQSLTDALKGVDVVFSTLRDSGLDEQVYVIRAAKAAGVRLYVPSEYGRNTIGNTTVYLKAKSDAHQLLKEIGLPYTLFFTGIWPEITVTSLGLGLGIDFEGGKFELFGDGKKPASWTSPVDFVPFVVRIVTTSLPSEIENKIFEIEGDRKSPRDLVDIWEKKHGRKAQVKELSEEEVQNFIARATSEVFRFFPQQFFEGGMLISGKANRLWPEWNPIHSKWENIMP